ncbi:MAG: hypothetical protein B7Z73_03535, partial [Planctomycetia bacterium 21-64-5]
DTIVVFDRIRENLRLVRRGRARWQGKVHESLEVKGAVGQLHTWLDHDPLPTLASFLGKMHRYTTLAAEARIERNRAPRRADAWFAPAREIFRRLIWKQGIWDGPQGWAFCLLSGLSEWVLADKHRRLWHETTAYLAPAEWNQSSVAGAEAGRVLAANRKPALPASDAPVVALPGHHRGISLAQNSRGPRGSAPATAFSQRPLPNV